MKQIVLLACGLLLLAGCKKSTELNPPSGGNELVSGTAPGTGGGGGGEVVVDPNGFPCFESYESWNNQYPGVAVPFTNIPNSECMLIVSSRSSVNDSDFWQVKSTSNSLAARELLVEPSANPALFRIVVRTNTGGTVLLSAVCNQAAQTVVFDPGSPMQNGSYCANPATGECSSVSNFLCTNNPLFVLGVFNLKFVSIEITNLGTTPFCYNVYGKYVGP